MDVGKTSSTGTDTAENKSAADLLGMLNVLFSTEIDPDQKMQVLQNDYNFSITPTIEKELTLMGHLSDGIEAKGIETGVKIIKLYNKGISSEDIASSLQIKVEIVEIAINIYEEA